MGRLVFISSVMNSGKTSRLLQLNFDYTEIGKKTLLFKPALDDRETTIKSRNGLEEDCLIIKKLEDLEQIKKYDIVFVDEAQFLKKKEVDFLRKLSNENNVDIYCFGLKSNFKGNLFKGSKRLIEIADAVEELSTICQCGDKATMNLKYDNHTGKIIKNGAAVDCGYEDKYMSVCYRHWNVKNVKEIA